MSIENTVSKSSNSTQTLNRGKQKTVTDEEATTAWPYGGTSIIV